MSLFLQLPYASLNSIVLQEANSDGDFSLHSSKGMAW